MGFRRDGKKAHAETRSWQAWLAEYAELLRAAGLPPQVLRSRADWEYVLRHGYHGWPRIDFLLEELTAPERRAFRRLLEVSLSAEERQRGCAGWHFVCPPSKPPEADPEL